MAARYSLAIYIILNLDSFAILHYFCKVTTKEPGNL